MTPLQAMRAYPKLEFERPVFVTAAPGEPGILYVLEQEGRIRWFEQNEDVAEAPVWFDLTDRVRMGHNEEGLLGLAFAPDYAESGVFYLYYSASRPRRVQISRFTVADDGRADPASEQSLLTVEEPYGNHNGGTLLFGPDGYLYAGIGDGGAAGDPLHAGQDLSTLLASMIRIEVDSTGPYRIPAGNPFVDRPGARKEIWAYGLRNPWRFSFDRLTGELWAGDVGQDAHEEIDIVVPGGNYGWNRKEGFADYERSRQQFADPPIDPVIDYPRRKGQSVTGGYVYRGLDVPVLRGAYVYGDYVSGKIWALRRAPDGSVQQNELIANVPEVSSFGEDSDGELYAVSLRGGLYRFSPTSVDDAAPAFPTRLSQTGLFTDLKALTPSSRLRPYEPRMQLWSDGATKKRWLALPKGQTIATSAENEWWSFPVGTVTVKHFELPGGRRLETRVMVHERSGWAGYTYRWNDDGTDAELVTSPTDAKVRDTDGTEVSWYFPVGADCLRCHTEGYGRVLGIRTRQLAQTKTLTEWIDQGLFEGGKPVDLSRHPALPSLGDASASVSDRVRAYLDVNCGVCHHRGGPAPGSMDLRVGTTLERAGVVEVAVESRPEDASARRVAPGDPEHSEVLARMRSTGPRRMPPLATSAVDARAVALLERWIRDLTMDRRSGAESSG
jgi:uncharacterized repeat protein (TIGR03806 family)